MERPKMDAITHLMFQDGNARQAAEWYVSLVPGSSVDRVVGDDGPGQIVRFTLAGRPFMAFESPPVHDFGFTPAMSTYLTCEAAAQVDDLFAAFSDGGAVLMALGEYDFNPRYGWCVDRYGVSWQIGTDAI
jgi:predicted 3-demethylubiquinone-9 3-methyltransferase (glyoxalase superfamily)